MIHKLNTLKLIQAICNIKASLPEHSEITSIHFDDDSGTSFNYQVNSGKWEHVDFATKFKFK